MIAWSNGQNKPFGPGRCLFCEGSRFVFCFFYATLCFVFLPFFLCFSLQVRDTAEMEETRRESSWEKTTEMRTLSMKSTA